MDAEKSQKIRAMVVDDTAFMRRAIVEILSANEDIEVVGVARHGREALEAVEELDPDVITLDVDMPVMDGLTTIKHLMVRKPRPVIMVSGMADQGRVTFEALRLGAVDFFQKPSGTISLDMKDAAHELGQVVRVAARLNPGAIRRVRLSENRKIKRVAGDRACRMLAVFAMDGACGSFIRLMSLIDSGLPLAVAAQQTVSDSVLKSYASEFNQKACWDIHANEGGTLKQGNCLIAGFGHSWRLSGDKIQPELDLTGPNATYDQFLLDCASQYGPECMAVVLGGVQNPAPEGLARLQQAGGRVVALAPQSCVCSDASKEVIEAGHAEPAANEMELARIITAFANGGDIA